MLFGVKKGVSAYGNCYNLPWYLKCICHYVMGLHYSVPYYMNIVCFSMILMMHCIALC